MCLDNPIDMFFYRAALYASALYTVVVCLSVRLSVRLSVTIKSTFF